jgi:hypothetical protein
MSADDLVDNATRYRARMPLVEEAVLETTLFLLTTGSLWVAAHAWLQGAWFTAIVLGFIALSCTLASVCHLLFKHRVRVLLEDDRLDIGGHFGHRVIPLSDVRRIESMEDGVAIHTSSRRVIIDRELYFADEQWQRAFQRDLADRIRRLRLLPRPDIEDANRDSPLAA